MKLIKNIPLEVVKRNTLALAKTAKLLGIPVILTSSQEQNQQGLLMPELEQILPEAFAARVKRAGIVNAWTDPHFKQAVEATGREISSWPASTTDVCLVFPTISAAAKAIKSKRSWMLRGHLTKYPKKCHEGAWSEKGCIDRN
jgi:hypothetical protein